MILVLLVNEMKTNGVIRVIPDDQPLTRHRSQPTVQHVGLASAHGISNPPTTDQAQHLQRMRRRVDRVYPPRDRVRVPVAVRTQPVPAHRVGDSTTGQFDPELLPRQLHHFRLCIALVSPPL